MKNIRLSQVMMLMSLALGSTFTMLSYNNTPKYAHDKTKQGKQKAKDAEKQSQKGKKEMKCIEADLNKIKREFEKDHNAERAHEELDKMNHRIKRAVQDMKEQENAGRMYETHEHTLNRKLKEVRKYVKDHAAQQKAENKKKKNK